MKTLTINTEDVLRFDDNNWRVFPFYKWVSWQFNGSIFVELGTSNGLGAKLFADNPSNLVITYDIRVPWGDRLKQIDNVVFKHLDATTLNPEFLSKVDVIHLDIDHGGENERKILELIEPHFKGILIMDDVDHPDFPELHDLFCNLDREKHLLKQDWPGKIGKSRGTGVVPYGDWTVVIEGGTE